jgi:hypothetical protein
MEIEKKIPLNSANGYNQQKVYSSSVRRLFWRQSKRTIDRLSKALQKGIKFKGNSKTLNRFEACVVCSLDECLEEEDVLVYCDLCSTMVHRLCLGLTSRELKEKKWFCPNCQRKNLKNSALRPILVNLTKHAHLDVNCGRKSKDGTRKKASEILKTLFDLPESSCIFCGKTGSITVPIHGVPDHFGHISCAKWTDGVYLSDDYDYIGFDNPEELVELMNPFNEEIELWKMHKQFFSSTLYPVNDLLEKLFQSKNFASDLNVLKDAVKIAFKSSSPTLIKSSEFKFSTRLKKNNNLKLKQQTCKCLFHSLISHNFLYILRRHISHSSKQFSNEDMISKLTKILKELYPYIKGNYHRPRSPKGMCMDCHLPSTRKCRICLNTQGLFFKCSEENCKRTFHMECARRVTCEVVPKGLLSNRFLVFCPDHSKSSVFRRVDNQNVKLTKKYLEICNNLVAHSQKVLQVKQGMEKEFSFRVFEDMVMRESKEEREKNLWKPVRSIKAAALEEGREEEEGVGNGEGKSKVKNGKTKRIKKNKFLKYFQNREMFIKEKLKNSVLNSNSFWFLQFKKVRVMKQKITWNISKNSNNEYSLKNVSLYKM